MRSITNFSPSFWFIFKIVKKYRRTVLQWKYDNATKAYTYRELNVKLTVRRCHFFEGARAPMKPTINIFSNK